MQERLDDSQAVADTASRFFCPTFTLGVKPCQISSYVRIAVVMVEVATQGAAVATRAMAAAESAKSVETKLVKDVGVREKYRV